MSMRDQIAELKEKRAGLYGEMRDLTVKAESEDRDLTSEEAGSFDKLETDATAIGQRAERMEKVAGLEHKPERQVRQVVEKDGHEKEAPPKDYAEWRERQHGGRPQDAPEYREALYVHLLRGDDIDPDKFSEVRALSKATAAAGANLVPTGFEAAVIEKILDYGVMRTIASIDTTDSGETVLYPTETAAGIAAWTAENAAFAESDDAFGQLSIGAHKATRISKVSEELLADTSYDLEGHLTGSFARAFGVLFNTAYVVGDGTAKPTGVTVSATAGKTGATGQTLSVTADDLMDLYHSILPAYRRNASWLMNDSAIKVLRKLKTGVTGDNTYLWQPGLTAGAPDTLLGRPVFADPDMPAMAAGAKSILFGDFSYYQIRDARGLAFQRLNELYAANGQVGFRGYLRTDGKLLDTAAIRAYVNSAT